jgi:serine/threonine protein kinase
VADWGLTRRPRGQPTNPGRTRAGTMFGTEGFADPELSADAHNAGPEADIYSIGQIIGWALLLGASGR